MIKTLIFILLIGLSGCNKTTVVPIEQNEKIVALGDSLTFGYGGEGATYPEELGKIIERRVVNEGVNGDTSLDVLNRLDEMIENEKPNYVLLAIGGNDMLRGVPDDIIIKNINKIIDNLQEHGIKVILIAEPRPKAIGMILGLSDAGFYKTIAKDQNILVINDVFSSLLQQEQFRSDLIHLNKKGYIKAAEKVSDTLKDNKLIIK